MSPLLVQLRKLLERMRSVRSRHTTQWVEPSNSVTRAILAQEAAKYFEQAPPGAASVEATPRTPEEAWGQHAPVDDGDSHHHGSAA